MRNWRAFAANAIEKTNLHVGVGGVKEHEHVCNYFFVSFPFPASPSSAGCPLLAAEHRRHVSGDERDSVGARG